MEQTTQAQQVHAKLAEGALRNLHLDCFTQDDDPKPFASRMLNWDGEGLLIQAPRHHGRPVLIDPGRQVICSCRLGREILRFTAVTGVPAWPRAESSQDGAVRLIEVSEPQMIQRRRYYRVMLAGREPASVTCWLVELDPNGATRVCSTLRGQMLDLSRGGLGVVVQTDRMLEPRDDRQLWVRFALPDENESLIFRVALRHVQPLEEEGRYRIGLEFLEYVEPGQHHKVVDRLARFVAAHSDG